MSEPTYYSGILLTKAYRAIRAKTYECLDAHDLNASQWSIVGLVYEAKNGITLSEVANAMSVKKPLITLLVDKLVDGNIIRRVDNKSDSRSKLLLMEPKGKVLVKELEASLKLTLMPLFDGVSENKFLTYLDVLKSVISNEQKIKDQRENQ
jgi:DNA-binding MarR family transcriptional regulator